MNHAFSKKTQIKEYFQSMVTKIKFKNMECKKVIMDYKQDKGKIMKIFSRMIMCLIWVDLIYQCQVIKININKSKA